MRHKFGIILLGLLLQACGGGGGNAFIGDGGSATVGNTTVSFGSGFSPFVGGAIQVDQSTISAGGTTILRVRLVNGSGDAVANSGLSVSFSSECTALDKAEFALQSGGTPATSFPLNDEGALNISFTDKGCSASGADTSNLITAQVVVEDVTLTARGTVTITQGSAGGIQLVSPLEPTELALNGSVATDARPQTVAVEFKVVDGSGNQSPVQGQRVCFSLNTSVGGLSLSVDEDVTGADGLARTVVSSGNVSTAVVVTAKVAGGVSSSCAAVPANARATQNDNIVVSTGLPDQDGFTLASDLFSTEGYDRADAVANLTVSMNDLFNNPVRDGMVVFFTTEGGTIQGQCSTLNGSCSVAWTSTNDKPFDGRVTVTAYTIGEESFVDANGNGLYDAGESFGDGPEPFFDANESGSLDLGLKCPGETDPGAPKCIEEFADFNQNGIYDSADGAFTGSRCASGCSADGSLYVGASTVLIMARSVVNASFNPSPVAIPSDGSIDVTVSLFGEMPDGSIQRPPAGSSVSVSSDVGDITSDTNFSIPDGTQGPYQFVITVKDNGDAANGKLRVKVTVPSCLETLNQTDISQP